jgi:TRAP-type C4-dicarboxylate transport system permease small subunit
MESFRKALGKAFEAAVVVIMAVLVLDVVWQVVARFVLRSPCTWSEELARMLLIWVALLGAAVGFTRQAHLGIDYLVLKLRPRSKAAVELFVYLLVAFFAGEVMIRGGVRIVWATLEAQQVSASLGVRMGYVYLALPLSGALMLLYGVEMALKKLAEAWPREAE